MTTFTLTAPPTDRINPYDTEEPTMRTTPPPEVNRAIDTEPRAPDSPRPPGEEERVSIEVRRPVARCADGHGTLTGLFFSEHLADIARAKAMCGLCPLRDPCLAGALEREEPWGVWGGELVSGGRIIAGKRPCGRPPKRPRPEVVYDELGPVGVVA